MATAMINYHVNLGLKNQLEFNDSEQDGVLYIKG